MAMKQEANSPVILTIGAVSGFLVLVVAFGVEAWFRYEERTEQTAQWDEAADTWYAGVQKHAGDKADDEHLMVQILHNGPRSPQMAPQLDRLLAPAGSVDAVNKQLTEKWKEEPPFIAPPVTPTANHIPIKLAMEEIVKSKGKLPETQPATTQQSRLKINKEATARLGISESTISVALHDALGERQVTTIFTQLNQYHVVLKVNRRAPKLAEDLKNIYVRGEDGVMVALADVVEFEK